MFDFADPSMVVGRRDVSTVAPQALFLMNHPFVLEQARQAARRLLAEPGLDDARPDRPRLPAGAGTAARPTAERRIGLDLPSSPATASARAPRGGLGAPVPGVVRIDRFPLCELNRPTATAWRR